MPNNVTLVESGTRITKLVDEENFIECKVTSSMSPQSEEKIFSSVIMKHTDESAFDNGMKDAVHNAVVQAIRVLMEGSEDEQD